MTIALDRSDYMQNNVVDRLQFINSFCKRSQAPPSGSQCKYVDEMSIKTMEYLTSVEPSGIYIKLAVLYCLNNKKRMVNDRKYLIMEILITFL